MPTQTEKQKKLLDILKHLPPEKLDEVLDFAEYLNKKTSPRPKTRKRTAPLKVQSFRLGHIAAPAFDRSALYGECTSVIIITKDNTLC